MKKGSLILGCTAVLGIVLGIGGCTSKNHPSSEDLVAVAGTGTEGYSGDGGPATLAEFDFPGDVALDSSGNLYVCDQGNQRIRKIDAKGIVTTVAGNGEKGLSKDGGPATSVPLSDPTGLAVDRSGNLYFSEMGAARIRMVTPKGIIKTFWGTRIGAPAHSEFILATAIVLGADGYLYAPDMANVVRKIDPQGRMMVVAGNGKPGFLKDGSPATSAPLMNPSDVALDGTGNLYIADGSCFIRKVDGGGTITTVYSGVPGMQIQGMAFDGSGVLFFSDSKTNRILKLAPNGEAIVVVKKDLSSPNGITFGPSGELYIADSGHYRIVKVLK